MDEKVPGLKAIKEGSTGERSPVSPQSEENNSLEGEDHMDRTPKVRSMFYCFFFDLL
ncbi:unnamed protein product [Strongylus vulgaris]|uniref:Uncharacterized protein n=1 Tax=Strongylus vulgaris TaxID=40348 RepID=A0A3P7KHF3_STRVU|nr:unnamed protein product [Strongylus vulgaris]